MRWIFNDKLVIFVHCYVVKQFGDHSLMESFKFEIFWTPGPPPSIIHLYTLPHVLVSHNPKTPSLLLAWCHLWVFLHQWKVCVARNRSWMMSCMQTRPNIDLPPLVEQNWLFYLKLFTQYHKIRLPQLGEGGVLSSFLNVPEH